MALNWFKLELLGDRHVPNVPQSELVVDAFADADMVGELGKRSWAPYFATPATRTRSDVAATMDRLLRRRCPNPQNRQTAAVGTNGFILPLLEDGLIPRLLQRTQSKQVVNFLAEQSAAYVPVSPLHMHVDAVEAVASTEGNGDAPWQILKRVAATRLMSLLHDRWNSRSGSVYATLSSTLSLELAQADADDRKQIEARYERWPRHVFERHFAAAPKPRWHLAGMQSDSSPSHAHKLLLALAADTEFLVADRFERWVLDLATAALAMHAMACSDLHASYGHPIQPELLYWRAFDMLFFADHPADDLVEALEVAMQLVGARCDDDSLDVLFKARAYYRATLGILGVRYQDIAEWSERCRIAYPLEYRPSGPNESA